MHKRMLPYGDYDHTEETITILKNLKLDKVIFNYLKCNDLKKFFKIMDKNKISYSSCIK